MKSRHILLRSCSVVFRSFLVIVLGSFLLTVPGSTYVQDQPDIVWQANNTGKALAFSSNGQMLLAGTKLWGVLDGTLLRTFVLPYNGGGVIPLRYRRTANMRPSAYRDSTRTWIYFGLRMGR